MKRTGSTDAPLTVFYDLGGTATNGEDYIELSGMVMISEGRRSAVISVVPIDDEIHEDNGKNQNHHSTFDDDQIAL